MARILIEAPENFGKTLRVGSGRSKEARRVYARVATERVDDEA
jgi:hypothetical protein